MALPKSSGPTGLKIESYVQQRIYYALPKNGLRYSTRRCDVHYNIATTNLDCRLTLRDDLTKNDWCYTFVVDTDALERASPGDWSVLDRQVDDAVQALVLIAAKAEAATYKPKEQDDVPNQTKWSYTKKSRGSSVVRKGTAGGAEVHSLKDRDAELSGYLGWD